MSIKLLYICFFVFPLIVKIPLNDIHAQSFRKYDISLLPIVNEENKWGYIDSMGNLIIPFKFSYANNFFEDLAAVRDENYKWGYIDKQGIYAIQPQYYEAKDFSENLAAVCIEKENLINIWVYLNKQGEIVIHPFPSLPESSRCYAFNFSDGLAKVIISEATNTKCGYINKEGKFKIPFQFSYAEDFSEGLAAFSYNELTWGYIDTTGKIVIYPQFNDTRKFSDGLAAVRINNIDYYYIDKSGKVVIDIKVPYDYKNKDGLDNLSLRITSASEFSEGLAPVQVGGYASIQGIFGGKWGYIDKKGNFIIKPIFFSAEPFSEGLAFVGVFNEKIKQEEKVYSLKTICGYINKSGDIVIYPQYEQPIFTQFSPNFCHGIAGALIENTYFYINKKGNTIR